MKLRKDQLLLVFNWLIQLLFQKRDKKLPHQKHQVLSQPFHMNWVMNKKNRNKRKKIQVKYNLNIAIIDYDNVEGRPVTRRGKKHEVTL